MLIPSLRQTSAVVAPASCSRKIPMICSSVIYDLLFKASAETTLTIAADPKHLGARIGFMSVLHTWGSALTHHPHVHMVVPGGGLSPDGSKWIACRPRYFLTVQVLSALFRRLFLEMLVAAHHAGRLQFFGEHARLADKAAFASYLAPLREINWVVYAKEPFAGPPAPPINDRSDERHSGRLSADSAHARISVRELPPVAPPILSRHAQNARSY